MKIPRRILLILLVLFSYTSMEAQENLVISWDYSGLGFGQFAVAAQKHDSINFFYKDEWVSGLRFDEYHGPVLLTELLDKLFNGRSLYYYFDNKGDVIITKDYIIKTAETEIDTGHYFIPTGVYGEAESSQGPSTNVVEIGNPADRNKPGDATLSGYITNSDTREAVAGVTVFNQKLSIGVISNEYGFYSLTMPRGAHLIQFSFIGMKGKTVSINLNGSGEMNVEMISTLIPLKETVISADRNMVLKRYEVGVEKVNLTSFKLLPTSMGESDIIKSFLLLPGVQTVGEGSAGFNVRGGSADQNLILLDNAPVYNPSHFFGFFSAINSDMIKDVTLYKGGIPSRFGGRISSIIDIETRDGDRNEFAGNAGISPITAHLTIEGPVKKDTCTFIVTGRTTYSNWLFTLINNPALKRSRASFYDLNAKLSYSINKNNKLEISSYTSHDSFRFSSDTVYAYDNSIISAQLRHFFNSRFFSLITLNNSNYRYDISGENGSINAFTLSHRVNSTGLKADFNYYMGRHEFNFGSDFTFYSVLPGSNKPANDSSIVSARVLEKEKGLEGALYFDDKFILNDIISVNAGIRLSAYSAIGPRTRLIYDPDFSKSFSSVTDTLTYKSGSFYKLYGGPEFRVSVNFTLSGSNSLKVNYNRTRQYIHLLSNSASISPTDTWKLCDYYLKPQKGDQYAVGFYQMLDKSTIEASAEIYYKTIRNMVDYKGGTSIVMNENIEQDLVGVTGRAYGLELLVKKPLGRIRWSVGYTFSKTFLRSTGKFSDEIINKGKWFPSSYDRPNDLVLTFNYLFSRRLSLSANYVYTTGRPITYPISGYYFNNVYIIYYSDRNEYRIPDYSRLDLSLKVSGNLRSHRFVHPSWTFSVYNLLGRQNVYSEYFNLSKNQLVGYKLSVFGRAIPSITLNFNF